jgi:hypothetical protein
MDIIDNWNAERRGKESDGTSLTNVTNLQAKGKLFVLLFLRT